MSVVDRVLEALNAHDLDAFVACYAAEATIEDGYDELLARGHSGLRERYGAVLDADPDARWQALDRIETGPFVVQHEEVAGRGPKRRHVCVYLVRDDLILRERVLR